MSDPLDRLGREVGSVTPDVGAIKARAERIQRRRRVLVSGSAVAIAAIALAGVVLRPGGDADRPTQLAQSTLSSPTPQTEYEAAAGAAAPPTTGLEAPKRAAARTRDAAVPEPGPQEQKAMAATTSADSDGGDALEVTVAASDVAGPHSVRFTLQACNRQSHQVQRTFGTGQRYDFDVSRDGNPVWRWSDGMAFTQQVGEETWAAKTCKSWSVTWNGANRNGAPAPTGRYQVVGTLTSSPKQSSSPKSFCLDLC